MTTTAVKYLDNLIKTLTTGFDINNKENKNDDNDDKIALFWITDNDLRDACDYIEYGNKIKYPYIKYMARTLPSIEFRKFWFKRQKNRRIPPQNLKHCDELNNIRKRTKNYLSFIPIKNKNSFNIRKEIICNIECEWISYKNSSINNGILIGLHGGGYVFGNTTSQYALSELLSKITGCHCLLINYSLAPENPLPKGMYVSCTYCTLYTLQ